MELLAVLLMVALMVGFLLTVRKHGYWKARTIGVGVVAVLFVGYVVVLALGQVV